MKSVTQLLDPMLFRAAVQALPMPGDAYIVDVRCVMETGVQRNQVSYGWRQGNTIGSGTLPADRLGAPCNAAARPPESAPAPSADPTPAAYDEPSAAAAQAGFAEEILGIHNRLRCIHGASPLRWSNDIARYSQRSAEHVAQTPGLPHSHSFKSPLGRLGENLFRGSASGAKAAQDWYDESEGYDHRRVEQTGITGHFTAMIWKGVRYLGCSRVGDVVVCNHSAGSEPADCADPNFNMHRCALQQVLPVSPRARACR